MKNVVKQENYYYPWDVEKAHEEWVHHYNHERDHESLDNVTPVHVNGGRRNEILDQHALVKARTMSHSSLIDGYRIFIFVVGRSRKLERPEFCSIVNKKQLRYYERDCDVQMLEVSISLLELPTLITITQRRRVLRS